MGVALTAIRTMLCWCWEGPAAVWVYAGHYAGVGVEGCVVDVGIYIVTQVGVMVGDTPAVWQVTAVACPAAPGGVCAAQ
jgi:hypothetical protein